MGSTYTKREKRYKKSKVKSQKSKGQFKSQKLADFITRIGIRLLIVGLLIFTLTFYPVIIEEIKYYLTAQTSQKSPKIAQIKPVDEDFGILIPKINANAKVIANVNPFNPKDYQWQLTKGVAHAKNTALPDQKGNIFLFAHSSDNWYNANRYNSVFYLINKLEKGDTIEIYYKKKKYNYQVIEKKLVSPTNVSYLSNKLVNTQNSLNSQTLTLMTCWPPGTTYKRLIVKATISD